MTAIRRTLKTNGTWTFIVAYLAVFLFYALLDFGVSNTVVIAFSGLLQAMLLFMVAAGFSIIFGLLDVLNFAQGGFFMVGAYIGATLYVAIPPDAMSRELAFLLSLGVAVLIGVVMGAVIETGLIRPLYKRPVFTLLLTYGLSLVLREVVHAIWGAAPLTPPDLPPLLEGKFTLFAQEFSVYRLFIIAVGFLMMFGVMLLLRRTRIGIIIRAGLQDPEMVEALGVNVRQVFTLVFIVGTVVATLGGMVVTPFRGAFLEMGDEFLLGAIIVVIIGGLGSYEGTAIASIMVGLTRAVAAKVSLEYFNAPVLEELSILAVMVFVLLVKPSGLFGREE